MIVIMNQLFQKCVEFLFNSSIQTVIAEPRMWHSRRKENRKFPKTIPEVKNKFTNVIYYFS